MKSERGITLMVLVLTIMIIIIISGVSIKIIYGNDSSTVKQVFNETTEQRNKVEKEKEKMDNTIDMMEEEWGLS